MLPTGSNKAQNRCNRTPKKEYKHSSIAVTGDTHGTTLASQQGCDAHLRDLRLRGPCRLACNLDSPWCAVPETVSVL